MKNPLISVIVPIYKVEEFLDECVQSIVDQTYTNLEIILVDDGSPDKCPELCDAWAKKDSRIKVIHKMNGGQSAARNAGIAIAQGDFIGFVDSDDYIHKNMYSVLLEAMRNSDLKMSYCMPYRVLINGEINALYERSEKKNLNVLEALDEVFYGKIDVSVWSKLYARSVFERIRFPEGEVNEEIPMIIPTIMTAGGIVHTGENLYYYRVREGSTTTAYWKTDADIVLKHLMEVQEQIDQNRLCMLGSFKHYLGKSAYSTALYLDKNYDRITEKAKENQSKYIAIMRKVWFRILFSKYMKFKDKLLYLMVATRTLRPIYKILGKQ